jgi:AraC family ethanolamine operon transcriptional activator
MPQDACGKLPAMPLDDQDAAPAPGPAIFPAGFVGDFASDDLDELAATARRWDQHYTQIGPGRFSGRVVQVHTARLQFGTVTWSAGVLACGAVPGGAVSILLPLDLPRSGRIAGRPIGRAEIATQGDREEFDFWTGGASRFVVVSVERGLLDAVAGSLFGAPWAEVAAGELVLPLGAPHAAAAELSGLFAAARREPGCLATPARAAWLEQAALVALLHRLDRPRHPAHPAARHRLAKRAEEFLMANLHRPLTIGELCAATGAAERTLHLGFRERFGLPPIAFLKVLRLNGARRELRRPDETASVTQVATAWGFFHFGEFAAAYRRLFGELPSATLRRAASLGAAPHAEAAGDRPTKALPKVAAVA